MATASGPGLPAAVQGTDLNLVGLDTPGPEWVAFRTEGLFGPQSGGFQAIVISAQPLGGGGIEPQQRPQLRPLTTYTNPEAMGLAMTVLLNGWPDTSIEAQCRALERMAGMFVSGDPGPALLIVKGAAVPHCSGAEALRHRWRISDQPDFSADAGSDTLLRNGSGRRLRQQVSFTLLLDVEATELQRVQPRQAQPNFSVRRAKAGDTYEKFARRELGSAKFGKRLAQLNGDRDANKKLKEGQKVRMPTDHLLGIWKKG